jgi:ankyrin
MVRMLLCHGVKLNAKNHWGETVLHVVSRGRQDSQSGACVAELLLEHGADVNARSTDHSTPLHLASHFGKLGIVRLLLDHGTDANAETEDGLTFLHQVSFGRYEFPEDGVRVAELLLEHGREVDARDKYCWTPLHGASQHGKLGIVHLLLDHGADVNAETDDWEKPLHRVSYGISESQEAGVRVAQLLLERGADVNARRKDNQTPLHLACYFGNFEIVHLLLDHGADLEANSEGDDGEKPIHQVSYGEYRSQEDGIRVAQLLLERGADMNTRRKDQQTPLHLACYFGNVEIVRLLLDHGADPEAITEGDGEKPLHKVSYGEYRSQEDGVLVAQLLLDRSADVNTRRKDDWTPLHVASYIGNVEIIRLLLDYGADPEAIAEGDMGEKPLHQVSYGKYRSHEDGVHVAQLLLDRGANVNTRRNDHLTPLHVASHFGNIEIVQLLLDHGADLEAETVDVGETPLHRVSYGKYRSQEDGVLVTQLLLDRGADVNTRRKDHWTPLHVASYLGKADIVQLLIDHGAEVSAVDDSGESPLHDVSQGDYESQEDGVRVAQILLDHGADVNAKAMSGHTPLDSASLNERPKLAELFLQHAANVNAPRRSAIFK